MTLLWIFYNIDNMVSAFICVYSIEKINHFDTENYPVVGRSILGKNLGDSHLDRKIFKLKVDKNVASFCTCKLRALGLSDNEISTKSAR